MSRLFPRPGHDPERLPLRLSQARSGLDAAESQLLGGFWLRQALRVGLAVVLLAQVGCSSPTPSTSGVSWRGPATPTPEPSITDNRKLYGGPPPRKPSP